MSELKIFKDMEANCANCPFDITEGDIKRCYDDCGDKPNECYECSYLEYYLKSEADKVIEFWKEDSRRNYARFFKLSKRVDGLLQAERELRHNKYKRCLAMARWCDTKADWYYGIGRSFRDRVEFYIKWHKRWLELAEKFKSNKSTAQ